MRSVALITQLAFVTQVTKAEHLPVSQQNDAQDSMNNVVDMLADKLLDRGLNTASLLPANLDDATLGKGTQLAIPLQSRMHVPAAHIQPAFQPPLSFQGRSARIPSIMARASQQKEADGVSQQKLADGVKFGEAEHVEPEIVATKPLHQQQLHAGPVAVPSTKEQQQLGLMAFADAAAQNKNFLASLAFGLAAASIFVGDDVVNAATAAIPAAAAGSVDFGAILAKASAKALGGGKAGATAAVVQVISLMWLRTAMNYQYRYGGDLGSSLKTLMAEGGIGRLYQGLPFALIQGPLSRFGDTATNVGVLALFDALPAAAGVPGPVRTFAASFSAGVFRIFCTPIDTAKTAMQVQGKEGLAQLTERIKTQGPAPLYQGAIASAVATIAGNYPWFLTYNTLDGYLPPVSKDELLMYLLRSAFLGLSASCVSDTVSNSLRVIKTTQQTAALGDSKDRKGDTKDGISILEALQIVLDTDGIKGLFGRGLQTRLLTNAIQGSLFSVLWRYFQTSGTR